MINSVLANLDDSVLAAPAALAAPLSAPTDELPPLPPPAESPVQTPRKPVPMLRLDALGDFFAAVTGDAAPMLCQLPPGSPHGSPLATDRSVASTIAYPAQQVIGAPVDDADRVLLNTFQVTPEKVAASRRAPAKKRKVAPLDKEAKGKTTHSAKNKPKNQDVDTRTLVKRAYSMAYHTKIKEELKKGHTKDDACRSLTRLLSCNICWDQFDRTSKTYRVIV